MNQSKFSLADVLTVSGAIIFGTFCFFSFNFLSLGETVTSIVWATVIALILAGLALGAKLLKKTNGNFKTRMIWEWIFLFLFVVMSLIFMYPFSHYFAVYEQREDIQKKVIANITEAEGLFATYENYANNRLNIHQNHLNSVALAKSVNPSEYRTYGFVDGTSDRTQIENKMFVLKTKLFPSNYQEMKLKDSSWLASSKAIIASWMPLGVVDVVKGVEENLNTWKGELKEFSSFKAQGEISDEFDFPLTFDDVTSKFTQLGSPTVLSIGIAIFLYLMMLFSYFITRRDTRYPGLKVIFGTLRKEENEW